MSGKAIQIINKGNDAKFQFDEEALTEILTAKSVSDRHVNIFDGTKLPEPKAVFEATVEENNFVAMNEARQIYIERMEHWFKNILEYVEPEQFLNCTHKIIKDLAVKHFNKKSKMGENDFSKNYLVELEFELEAMLVTYLACNEKESGLENHKTFDMIKNLLEGIQHHCWLGTVSTVESVLKAGRETLPIIQRASMNLPIALIQASINALTWIEEARYRYCS